MKGKKVLAFSALLSICFLFVALLFSCGMGVKTASAEQAENEATVEVVEEIEQNKEVVEPEKTEHTFSTRVTEWFSNNFLEFMQSVDLLAVAGGIVAIIIDKKTNKKFNEETKTTIKENTTEMQRNTASNDEVLKVANKLIDATNELTVGEEVRDENIRQVLLLNKAVLEILVTVYVNNKNIPQAVKDLVNLKYVTAIKDSNDTAETATGTEV